MLWPLQHSVELLIGGKRPAFHDKIHMNMLIMSNPRLFGGYMNKRFNLFSFRGLVK